MLLLLPLMMMCAAPARAHVAAQRSHVVALLAAQGLRLALLLSRALSPPAAV